MKVLLASSGTALAAILALACASPDKPRLTWLRADGTPATRAELQAAKQECLASTSTDPNSPHPRAEHQAYAQKIVQCVQGKGYQLVDEDQAQ
jgi:hypothetical protein